MKGVLETVGELMAEGGQPLTDEVIEGIPTIVKKLAGDLRLAYIAEHMARGDAQMVADRAERRQAEILHTAYSTGLIGGKGTNAETRKQQEAVSLAAVPDYRALLICRAELELHAAIAAAERRELETIISMTKAWWHTGAAEEGPE